MFVSEMSLFIWIFLIFRTVDFGYGSTVFP